MKARNQKNVSIVPLIPSCPYPSLTIITIALLLATSLSQCPDNCQTCSSPSTCTSCISQSNLLMVSSSLGCLPCPHKCQKCSSESSLTQCISCSQGYYLDPYLQSCTRCKSSNCLQCNEYFPTQCQLCETAYFLQESTSSCKLCASEYNYARNCKENFILTCQEGYFTANGQACLKCDTNEGCKSCVSTTVCSQCFEGYYLLTGKCLSCDASCRACNTNTSCTSCPRGFRLNTSSKCQACATSNCASCSIQDVCLQCHSSYYMQTSTRTCLLLDPVKSVQSCTRYASNFNNSITSAYAAAAILCRTCSNGTYLNLQTNTCQSCSLLCQNCAGPYRSSKCSSCNPVYARLFDAVTGVCGPKLYSSKNQKVVYRNSRNDAGVYYRGGKVVNASQGVLKCPGGQLAAEVGVGFSDVVGYEYKIYVRLLVQTATPPPFSLSILLNSQLITLVSIPNTTTTDCNNLKISTISLTFSVQSLISNSTSTSFPLNPTPLPNTFTIKSTQPQNLLIDIRQLIILVKECHQTCALCSSYDKCVKCKVESQYLQQERCVDVCNSGYFSYSYKKMCLLECPKQTFTQINSSTWTCQQCNSSCSSCTSSKICTSCLPGFYLYQDQCLPTCPQTYFPNALFNKCQKCITPCNTCTSTKHCLSCQLGFYYSANGTCLGDCPDGFYDDFQAMQCKQCKEPCSRCKSEVLCLGCTVQSKLVYFGFQCMSNCLMQYFSVVDSYNESVCQFCSFPCQQCTKTPTTCTQCITGFLLTSNNTCVASCPSQYFSSIPFSMCVACQSPCLNCLNSQKTCTSCIQNYFLMGTKCVTSCEQGYFKFSDTQCRICKSECLTCTTLNSCTLCAQDYFLQDTDCLTQCLDGYYKSLISLLQRTCSKCDSNCKQCFSQPDYCLSCYPNYFLQPDNTCSSICGPKQLTPGCSPCESPCYSCSTSTSNCTSCVNSYFLSLQTNECVTECYFGFYKVIDKGFGYCMACMEPCSNCQSLQLCYSCDKLNGTSYYLQSQSPTQKVCVTDCGVYQYKDQTELICMKCLQPCLTCTTATFCLTCLNGILVNGTCSSKIDGCPIGTYQTQSLLPLSPTLTTTLSTCLPCPTQCSSCKSPTLCTGCIQDFYLYGESCLDSCPSESAPIKQLRKCIFCEYPCAECYGVSSNCTKCSQMVLGKTAVVCPDDRKIGTLCIKYYLNKGECMSECSATTFPKGDQCIACLKPCLTCTSQTVCTSCIIHFYILQNTCYATCPDDYYAQPLTKQCEKCLYPCKTCLNQKQCLSCREGYLFGHQCLIKEACPVGYFQATSDEQNKLCEKCSGQCLACADTKDYCVECINLASYQGKCYKNCPLGYYSQTKVSQFTPTTTISYCTACPSECLTCTSPSQCTSCVFSYSLLSHTCIKRCPPTFLQTFTTLQFTPTTNYTVSQCSACLLPCRSCFLQQFLCQSCITGYYMYQQACVLSCPNGTYLDKLTQDCRECPVPCKMCVEKDREVVCMECATGHYVKEGVCVDRCNAGLIDVEGKTCVNDCAQGYQVQHIVTKVAFCAKECQLPYLKDQTHKRCVTNCSQNEYISAKYQCVSYKEEVNGLIPKLKGHLFVDQKGILTMYVEIKRPVEYTDTQPIEDNIQITIFNLNPSLKQFQTISAHHPINFSLTTQTPSILIFSLFPPTALQFPSCLSLSFKSNSHLYIVDKVSKLPIQSSHSTIQLKQQEFYEVYDYSLIENNRFAYVGQIIMDFILILGVVLLIFNRFAKLHHLLVFTQSLFLLACLDIPFLPNLYRFLQGFKYAHLYQLPNWFDSLESTERYTDFHGRNFTRLQGIFGDLAFLRVVGHVVGVYCMAIGIGVIIYGVKYLPQFKNQYLKFIITVVNQKGKHIKYSHLIDIFICTFPLTISAFFFQTHNYTTPSPQHSLSIALSYLLTLPLITFFLFITYLTHSLHNLSLHQPQQFIHHQYLHRQQYVPIFEGITSTYQSYKNYLLLGKMVMYGLGAGILWEWPNLCLAGWIIGEVVCATVYVRKRPFANDVQNGLYAVAGIMYAVAMVLLIALNQSHKPQSQFYLASAQRDKKILLGYITIVILLICTFLLITQTIISIIRGSLKPKQLQGENEDYNQVMNTSPNSLQISKMIGPVVTNKQPGPKRIQFEEKKEYLGYGKEESVDGRITTSIKDE